MNYYIKIKESALYLFLYYSVRKKTFIVGHLMEPTSHLRLIWNWFGIL